MEKYKKIILERYSDKRFAKLYYQKSKSGLKDYEKTLVKRFLNNAKKILVVGCGCGREIVPLAKMGKQVVAFDISKEMVKYAKRLCLENGVKAKIFVSDVTSTTLPENYFDGVVLLNCVLDQVYGKEEREELIENLRNALKPNGVCISVTNNALYPGANFGFYAEHLIHFFKFVLRKERYFLDRVYEDNGRKVYVHLSTPWELKKLFSRFKSVIITSDKVLEGEIRYGKISLHYSSL